LLAGKPARPEPLPPVGSLLSWQEVWLYHRSWRGIGRHSLLVDGGESGYSNQYLPDGTIQYPGEGRHGHQQATGGNLRLLRAVENGQVFQLFRRIRPGQWCYEGGWQVIAWTYIQQSEQQCWQYQFSLARVR
jgi:hypothetical protein